MMSWPWRKHRADVEEAQRREQVADLQKKIAASRREAAEDQAAHAETVSRKLRDELDRNGWTDLLQEAWKGR